MAYVEEAHRAAHGAGFVQDSRVLDRHLPPGERHDSSADLPVYFIERCPTKNLFGLAPPFAARAEERDDDEKHQPDEGDDERDLDGEHDEADERDELLDQDDEQRDERQDSAPPARHLKN